MTAFWTWLKNNGDQIRAAASLAALLALVGGGSVWVYRVDTQLSQLETQVHFLMATPTRRPNRIAGTIVAPTAHDQMCANLAEKLADAYATTIVESDTTAIENEMKELRCIPRSTN